jgi:radical SAM superfamily enzyme YgiQ (UPF0313 family)
VQSALPHYRNVSMQAGAVLEIGIELFRNKMESIVKGVTGNIAVSADRGLEEIKGKKIVVWFVQPTNYRPDGTPRKWEKLILPSNAISQLWTLMPAKIQAENGEEVLTEKHFLDDKAQPFDIDAIKRSMQGEDTKGVIMICGVQTNQWPRAYDLATLCVKNEIPVAVGGYHVRADLPVTKEQASNIGISLVIGEAEAETENGEPLLEEIMHDVWSGNLKQEYRQAEHPDISEYEPAKVIPEYQKLMMTPSMATMETSRGCPMPCSFCTIRTIGGHEVRARDPNRMEKWLREVYTKHGIRSIFITDDNFARSDQKFKVLEMFAKLRREGMNFSLMIQVDMMATAGKQGKHFMDLCRKAGVATVFLGVESLDNESLKKMNKPQNRTQRYEETIADWHSINVMTQCGYIIGHEGDTTGVGKRSAEALTEMGIDVAAPYILTPLPGSKDYHELHKKGYIHEADFNTYDSHSAAYITYPGGLSRHEVMREYNDFYSEFYSWGNFLKLADRLSGQALKTATRQWLWYKYAILKGDHPMCTGLKTLPPDFTRHAFSNGASTAVNDLVPDPLGPGSPICEERIRKESGTLFSDIIPLLRLAQSS